jgi:hypothetical protein
VAKKTTRKKRKQCAKKGCRKLRVSEEFCEAHAAEAKEGLNPIDHVMRLTEMDRLRFVEIDNDVRGSAQQIRILNLEQQQDGMQYEDRKRQRQAHVDTHSANIEAQQGEYKRLVQELGKKYGFDPAHVSIDDKTGVIRDNTPEEPKKPTAKSKKPKSG